MMIKKLLTLLLILIIGISIVPMTNAQDTSIYGRTINSDLKPVNAPDLPGTESPSGKSETECKAQGGTWANGTCSGQFEDEPVNAYIQILSGAVLMLSGGVAVIVIAVGGLMYVTSRGNQQQLEFAKNTLVYGIIGMLVITFSYFIISWVLQIITSV